MLSDPLINGRSVRTREDGFPVLRLTALRPEGVDLAEHKGGAWTAAEAAPFLVTAGDFLLCRGNGSRRLVGRGAMVRSNPISVAFPDTMIRVRVDARLIDSRYLENIWESALVRTQIEKAARTTAGIYKINQAVLEGITLPLPPLDEQRRIVEVLEDHLSRLDVARQSVWTAQRRTKPLLASVLDRTALGSARKCAATSTTTSDSRRMLTDVSSKRFDYEQLPDLPAGWYWRPSADVCASINSGSTPKAHLMHPGSGEIPFLKVYNITQDGRVDFAIKPTYVGRDTHQSQLKRSRVRPGDVLTNIVGPPLGKTAIVPDGHDEWNINQAIVAFRAGDEILPDWLALVLRSPFVLGLLQSTAKATAGQFNIALSTCRELPLPVPPLGEQKELIAGAAQLLEGAERLSSQAARTEARAEHLRQAILQNAFIGQLVPQDPADEPASELLAHIGAERAAQGKPKRARRTAPRAKASTSAGPPAASSTPLPQNAVQQEFEL
ncbi:restriction endonuclease subunit S [Streptomyces lunaelactis]|uniref:restriction endonuclease subunit S n=1 Tax=Streptomyces lunaelactis TaxID=1535768 RepID=UPI0015858B5F|nr:restriction endonuclease subunit S [Streptomyces lunaelactis]NUK19675.1 restriction endonuclease subunit S [Streptomyces lunaelactis]